MSILPFKADIRQREWRVRYVPEADIAADEQQANACWEGFKEVATFGPQVR
jgi:hypothetical protein